MNFPFHILGFLNGVAKYLAKMIINPRHLSTFVFHHKCFFAKSDSEDSGLGGCPTLTFDTLKEGVLTFRKNNRLFSDRSYLDSLKINS